MTRLIPAAAALMFCLSAGIASAQASSGGHGGRHHGMMKPCSQEADPAKCEANRKAMHENFRAAREACKGKADRRDRRTCMTEQVCSKAQDPGKCHAQAKERQARKAKRMDERQAASEACNGKRGEDLQKCLHTQREKYGRDRPNKS